MTKKPTLTGDGKTPGSDKANDNRKFDVVDGQGDFPAPLPLAPSGANFLHEENKRGNRAGVITPHGFAANRQAYKPQEPSVETLMRADHAEWLKSFSYHLSLETGVPMTAFRQGAITRLWWAFRYVLFIDQRNASLQERVRKLEAETEALSIALKATTLDLDRAMAALKRYHDPEVRIVGPRTPKPPSEPDAP